MDGLLQIDLRSIFVPSLHLAEGTVVYLFLFIILRVLRREAGAVSIADLLWSCSLLMRQNAMPSEHKSITKSAVVIGTIVHGTIFWMGYRFPWFYRLNDPGSLP